MLATALKSHIEYDKAAQVAKKAHMDEFALIESGEALGYFTKKEYKAWVKHRGVIAPKSTSKSWNGKKKLLKSQ